MQQLTLGELIERGLIAIELGTLTSDALSITRSQHIHHLPVFSGTTLVGLVCTCDLAQAPLHSPVDDWMSQPAVTLDAEASSSDAAREMTRRGVGSVIVTFEEAPCGILTRANLMAAAPQLEPVLRAARCESCGLIRPPRSEAAGHTYCTHRELPAAATTAGGESPG